MELSEYGRLDAVGLRGLRGLRGLLVRGEVSAGEGGGHGAGGADGGGRGLERVGVPVFDSALASDRAGLLAGVPFLIKDSGPVARGVAFGCRSRALIDVRADRDSDLMSRFRPAGLATGNARSGSSTTSSPRSSPAPARSRCRCYLSPTRSSTSRAGDAHGP